MARIERLDTLECWERLEALRSAKADIEAANDKLAEVAADVDKEPEDVEEAREELAEAQAEFDRLNEEAEDDGFGGLEALEGLADDVGETELRGGIVMIAECDFERYAQELAGEVCEIPDSWPCTCIDWERAARELRAEYSETDFAGTTYLWRS